jgi:hypothetical protein
MSKQIVFLIDGDGNMKTEYSGFEGDDCLDEAKELDRILEGDFGIETKKTSFKRKDDEGGAPRQKVRA